MSKTLAQITDRGYFVKQRIAKIKRVLKRYEDELATLEMEALEQLDAMEAKRFETAGNHTALIATRDNTNITDFDAFAAWVAANGAWELIRRQCNIAPFVALQNAGTPPPGVKLFQRRTVTFK